MVHEVKELLPLVAYRGKVWVWYGLVDRNDNLSLWSLKNDGAGAGAPRKQCRILDGDERQKQSDAIHYFWSLR